jgi:predicted NAD-dependent protein-ADP-ribosyltransferase YbiA (DUF1768 family)
MTPAQAKSAGNTMLLRGDWEDIKIDVMRQALRLKFQDEELLRKLKATAPKLLAESNDWGDKFWGQDWSGNGQNMLGRLLMEIRDSN